MLLLNLTTHHFLDVDITPFKLISFYFQQRGLVIPIQSSSLKFHNGCYHYFQMILLRTMRFLSWGTRTAQEEEIYCYVYIGSIFTLQTSIQPKSLSKGKFLHPTQICRCRISEVDPGICVLTFISISYQTSLQSNKHLLLPFTWHCNCPGW